MNKGRVAIIGLGISVLIILMFLAGGRLTAARQPATSPAEMPTGPWTAAIERIDEALAAGDARAAERAWADAHSAALASRHWEAMVEVGDASLRIGAATQQDDHGASRARRSYLTALFRARQAASVDGVQRVAEAFDNLGDTAAAEQAARIAAGLSAGRGAKAADDGEPPLESRLVGTDTVRFE